MSSRSTGLVPEVRERGLAMDAIIVEGGRPLGGQVRIGGAKNAVLPMMAASLLVPGPVRIRNVPRLMDVVTFLGLLREMGVEGGYEDHSLYLDASRLRSFEAPYDHVKKMRASIYVLGPLLARMGRARVSQPGGCAWGPRPVNFHHDAMTALGAKLELEHGYIVAEAPRLKGARITFDISSVGATGNALMAAVLAEGRTVIENAAAEPEIAALADFLIAHGARIAGAGTKTITIDGVAALAPTGPFENIPDRIEAGTMLAAGAITCGDVTLTHVRPDHLGMVIARLEKMGCRVEADAARSGEELVGAARPTEELVGSARPGSARPGSAGAGSAGAGSASAGSAGTGSASPGVGRIRLTVPDRRLRCVDIVTEPYPGFPTDLQAQFMALLCVAEGSGVVRDTIYLDRFTHVPELARLGARITLAGNVATVEGGARLQGARVMSTDIRASSALILAGLAAEGRTHVSRVYHIDRGYEAIEQKLAGLGARVERVREKGAAQASG